MIVGMIKAKYRHILFFEDKLKCERSTSTYGTISLL